MREISIFIENEKVKGDGVCIGAALSGRDVFIRAFFDQSWQGCSFISAQWTDARGGKATVDISEFSNERVFTVPFAAKKYPGDVYLTLKGGKTADGGETLLSATLSAAARFTVEDSRWDTESEESDMPDPTVAEQLTERMNSLSEGLSDVTSEISSAQDALSDHTQNENNPHGVTAAQTGAYYPNNPPPYPVTSVSGKSGDVSLTKSDVGLSFVDNTADRDKPVSAAQQAALDLKLDKNAKNVKIDDLLTVRGQLSVIDPDKRGAPLLVLEGSDDPEGVIRVSADVSRLIISDDWDDPVRLCGLSAPQNSDEAANKEYVDRKFNAAENYADNVAGGAADTASQYAADLAYELERNKIDKADGEATGLLRAENETVEGRLAIQNESGNGGMLRGYTSSGSRGLMLRVIEASDARPLTNSSGKEVLNARKDSFNFLVPIYVSSSVAGSIGVGMGGKRITSLGAPSSDSDAANKKYVDDNFDALHDMIPDVDAETHALEERLGGLIDGLEERVHMLEREARDHGWDI